MTREEAIAFLIQYTDNECYTEKCQEANRMAISALCPVSREQMEKVFPGCDFCKKELNDYPFITAIGEYGDSINSYIPQYCPLCGRPLTPEAWEETRKRMDVLKRE